MVGFLESTIVKSNYFFTDLKKNKSYKFIIQDFLNPKVKIARSNYTDTCEYYCWECKPIINEKVGRCIVQEFAAKSFIKAYNRFGDFNVDVTNNIEQLKDKLVTIELEIKRVNRAVTEIKSITIVNVEEGFDCGINIEV
jgi:hypothetical protein